MSAGQPKPTQAKTKHGEDKTRQGKARQGKASAQVRRGKAERVGIDRDGKNGGVVWVLGRLVDWEIGLIEWSIQEWANR